MHIVKIIEHKTPFLEICENVKINIDDITMKNHFFVMNESNHVMIFECSYCEGVVYRDVRMKRTQIRWVLRARYRENHSMML